MALNSDEVGDEVDLTNVVHLGFAQVENNSESRSLGKNELYDDFFLGHESRNWKLWDGGKLGGKPSWLNPREIPKDPVYCRDCYSLSSSEKSDNARKRQKMNFIAQLYCPLDEKYPSAFHRSLYVFVCSNPIHIHNNHSGCGVRVLRCQLARSNPFYPYDIEDGLDDNKSHDTIKPPINLCKGCGQYGNIFCPLQREWFCGEECQNERKDSNKKLTSTYKELELIVEEEPHQLKPLSSKEYYIQDSYADGDIDTDLDQKILNQARGLEDGVDDPFTLNFFQRIDRTDAYLCSTKDQCLRYQRWPLKKSSNIDDDRGDNENSGPLWISSNNIPTEKDIPPCPYCNGERNFEFQIMPQMLHFLRKESRNYHTDEKNYHDDTVFDATLNVSPHTGIKDMLNVKCDISSSKQDEILEGNKDSKFDLDWGVIAVYTCTNSCNNKKEGDKMKDDNMGAYFEEFAWRQPPLA